MPDIETIISALQISICVTVDRPSQNALMIYLTLLWPHAEAVIKGEREYRSLWVTTREKWTFVFSSNIPFFQSDQGKQKRSL